MWSLPKERIEGLKFWPLKVTSIGKSEIMEETIG